MTKKFIPLAFLLAILAFLSPASGLAQDRCQAPDWVSFHDPAYYWGLGEATVEKDLNQAKAKAYQNAVGELAKMAGQTITASITDIQEAQGQGKKTIEEFTVVSEVKAIAEHHLSGIEKKGEWLNPCLKVYYVLVVIPREEANRQVKENADQATTEELKEAIRAGIASLEARVELTEAKLKELESKYGDLFQRLAKLEEAVQKQKAEGVSETGTALATVAEQAEEIKRDMQAGKSVQEIEQKLTAAEWFQKAYDLNEQTAAKEGKKHSRLPEVIALYTKALEIDPKYAEAYDNRGVAYYNQGQYVQAISDYNNSLFIAQEDAKAYNNRGRSNIGSEFDPKKDKDIASELETYDAINQHIKYYNIPSHHIPYTSWSDFYGIAIADPIIACSQTSWFLLTPYNYCYQEGSKINQRIANSYYNLGIVYYFLGKYNEAIDNYDYSIRIYPKEGNDYAELCNRGLAYLALKQYDQALSDLMRAIKLNTKDGNAYYIRGVVYQKKGKRFKAKADLKKARKINPGLFENRE